MIIFILPLLLFSSHYWYPVCVFVTQAEFDPSSSSDSDSDSGGLLHPSGSSHALSNGQVGAKFSYCRDHSPLVARYGSFIECSPPTVEARVRFPLCSSCCLELRNPKSNFSRHCPLKKRRKSPNLPPSKPLSLKGTVSWEVTLEIPGL